MDYTQLKLLLEGIEKKGQKKRFIRWWLLHSKIETITYRGMISAAEQSQRISELEDRNNQLIALNSELSVRVEELTRQIKWFQKQLFGQKSERRVMDSPKEQLFLGQQFHKETDKEETQTIKEHQRKKSKIRSDDGDR